MCPVCLVRPRRNGICLMANQDTGTETKQDEFSKIFDEYRAKIEEITRRTEKSLRSLDATPDGNHNDENEYIEVVTAPPQPEGAVNNSVQTQAEPAPSPGPEPPRQPVEINNAVQTQAEPAPSPPPEPPRQPVETNGIAQVRVRSVPSLVPEPPRRPREVNTRVGFERPAFEESAEILYEARREAKKIIEEAEESAKKEAKKRTQAQVDKIIEKARKEAEDITTRASRNIEKVRDEVITKSKQEAEYIIREITQKYRQDTEAQSSRTIAEAQEKAGKMLADISASTQQIGQLITEIVTRAKKTINELETNLQTEAAELTRIITETQFRLEEVSKTAREEKPVPVAPPKQTQDIETRVNPSLAIRLIGEKSNGNNGTSALFSGQMEMKSVSASFDYQYLKKLKKYLVHIPNIKYLQEYASEKEMSVVFDIMEPLPLLDILSNIPMVDEVVTRADDDICLVFKNAE
jgi:vacuolar-type H+-ATPase subunit H